MTFLKALLELTDKYSTETVVLMIVVGIGAYLAYNWGRTRNRVALTESDTNVTLAQSINNMAESNNEIVRVTVNGLTAAEIERSKQLAVLTDLAAQIHSLATAIQSKEAAFDVRFTPVMPLLIQIELEIKALQTGQSKLDTLIPLFESVTPQLKTLNESMAEIQQDIKEIKEDIKKE